MKNKLVKGMGLAMAMALMATTMAPMTVQAGLDAGSVQYVPQNEKYSDATQEAILKDATANTTMTVTGSLADDTKSIDFTGENNTLNVQFHNLPAGYPNYLDFEYHATLDNGYLISIDGSIDEYNNGVEIKCWMEGADDYAWRYSIDTYALPSFQNEVNYDIANTYIKPLLKCIPTIESMKNAGATDDEIWDAICGITIDGYTIDEFSVWSEAFFNPAQYQVVSSELYVGIAYDYNISCGVSNGWWFYPDEPETTEAVDSVTPEETSQETVVSEETSQVTVVEGDLVYTVKAGDTLGSISANYYGNNSKGGAIREQNKEVFAATKGKLVEGMQLVLPAKLGSKTRIAEPVANEGEALYMVMHGDTLCGIAKKIYGTEAKLAELYARNSDRLSDSSKLFPGQVIVLPAK